MHYIKKNYLYFIAAAVFVAIILVYRQIFLSQNLNNMIDTFTSQFENDIFSFLTGAEGYEAAAVHESTDRANVFTVGFGSTYNWDRQRAVQMGDTVDRDTARRWLLIEANKDRDTVLRLVKVPLNDNQTVALSSFVYNVGEGSLNLKTGFAGSKMLRLLNNGTDLNVVAAEFDRWNKSNGLVNKGLTNRRAKEKALFLS